MSDFKDRREINSKIRNGKRHVSRREGIQQYCQGNFLSMVVFKGMSFLRKRCCAAGVKLGTCLGKNCPVSTPTPEDSGMSFSEQSGTPPLNQIPYNQILLQRFTPAVNPSKNLLLRRRTRTGKFFLGKLTQSRTQSYALILTHGVSLALNR